jgi:endoglucanase
MIRSLTDAGAAVVLAILTASGFTGAAIGQQATPPGSDTAAENAAETASGQQPERRPAVQLGVFDPYGEFNDATNVQIEHVFLPWGDVDLDSLRQAGDYARARNRSLLVTIEPWSWYSAMRLSADSLREGIQTGQYDGRIGEICGELDKLAVPVSVRWGHEMDLRNGRYPWSDWKAEDYIAAFRRFVTTCRKAAPRVTYMWSPRGEPDAADFYPGDAFVDSIGLSIFGLQPYDRDVFGSERGFAELLGPSYARVARFGKPVYIAEFGCAGDAQYVSNCTGITAGGLEEFPLLEGVIYFSAVDTGEWPAAYGTPNWTTSAEAVIGRR